MDDDPFDELRRGLRGALPGDGAERTVDVRRLAAAAVAAVALGLGVVLIAASRQPPGPSADEIGTRPEPVVDVVEAPAPETTAAPSARVWPTEPVSVEGTEVRSGAQRWRVGEPGDLVAVGDWDCDGTSTPAVLRPTTGRLHLFDAWASPDAAVTATPGPTVPTGAIALEPRGCGEATVRTADGQSLELSTVTR